MRGARSNTSAIFFLPSHFRTNFSLKESISHDSLVIATPLRPDRTLEKALAKTTPEVHSAGDCSAPGRIKEAITAGYRVALKICVAATGQASHYGWRAARNPITSIWRK